MDSTDEPYTTTRLDQLLTSTSFATLKCFFFLSDSLSHILGPLFIGVDVEQSLD